MEGAADVAETEYTPFGSEPDAVPVRLIVRRVKPTPGSQLALFTTYSYHAFITDREGQTLDLEADHRRHAEIENAIRDLKYGVGLNHLPSGRFPANGAWLAVQSLPRTRYGVIAHNLARWTTRIGLGEPVATTKTLRRRFFSLAGRLTRKARRLTLHLPQGWPWQNQFSSALGRLRALPLPSGSPNGVYPSARPPNCLADLRQAGSRVSPAAICPLISPVAEAAARQNPFRVTDTLSACPNPSGSTPCRPSPSPFISRLTSPTASLRWIGV